MRLKNLDRTEKLVLVIISITLLARFVIIPFNQGAWWDELVYLSLGKNVLSGSYSIDPFFSLESERPPLTPFIVSLSSSSILASRMLLSIMSIIGVGATYYLAKNVFGKKEALWATLFLSSSYFFLFFTSKALSESPFITFTSLSVLIFIKGLKSNRMIHFILAGVTAGLSIMSRHFGFLIVLSYIIFLAYITIRKKKLYYIKGLALIIFFTAISISPWVLISLKYYHSPIQGLLSKFSDVSGPYNHSYLETALDYLNVWHIASIFLVIGLIALFKNKLTDQRAFLVLIFFITFIFYPLMPGYKEPRYLMGFMPIVFSIASFGMTESIRKLKAKKAILLTGVIAVCLFSISASFFVMWNDRTASSGLIRAGIELNSIGSKGDVVMTVSFPYIYYFSNKRTVYFPGDQEEIDRIVKDNDVKYVLTYKYDSGYPKYVFDYFINRKGFEKIKSIEDAGDPEAIEIYAVKE